VSRQGCRRETRRHLLGHAKDSGTVIAILSSFSDHSQNDIVEMAESNVRAYSRRWPTVFCTASGASIVDEAGREFVDFFAGAGSLNYGHNPPALIEVMVDYLRSGGILNSLDTMTSAKYEFLEALSLRLLRPRGMDYRIQFTGPTGTCAVE